MTLVDENISEPVFKELKFANFLSKDELFQDYLRLEQELKQRNFDSKFFLEILKSTNGIVKELQGVYKGKIEIDYTLTQKFEYDGKFVDVTIKELELTEFDTIKDALENFLIDNNYAIKIIFQLNCDSIIWYGNQIRYYIVGSDIIENVEDEDDLPL